MKSNVRTLDFAKCLSPTKQNHQLYVTKTTLNVELTRTVAVRAQELTIGTGTGHKQILQYQYPVRPETRETLEVVPLERLG